MHRNMMIDVFVDDVDMKQKVIASIRLYRAACRKAFSACAMAEMSGAEIIADENSVKIKPKNASTKAILENAFGIYGKKAHLYELREWLRELHPSWLSIVPESIFRDIVGPRWRAPDPEFPKCKRGYLTLNGARPFAQFMRTGIAIKNTVPKLNERSFTIKWDTEIGPVEFNIGKLDGSRWHIWKHIRDEAEGWSLGTIYLKEEDGKLRALISYGAPDKEKELDKRKTMYVEFTDDVNNFICAYCGDDKFSGARISAAGAVDYVKEMEIIAGKYKDKYASLSYMRARNRRELFNVRSERQQERRAGGVKDWNHMWTRRLTEFAQREKAGNVVVIDMPEKTLFEYPWNWSQFKMYFTYKIEEVGGTVEYRKVEKKEAA